MPHLSRQRRKANQRRRNVAHRKACQLPPLAFMEGCPWADRVSEYNDMLDKNLATRAAEREAYRAAHPGGTSGPGGTLPSIANPKAVYAKARGMAFAGYDFAIMAAMRAFRGRS
jgi:hypothetical protein